MADKIWESFMDQIVVVMMEGMGLLIGRLLKNKYGVPCLKRPRMLQMRIPKASGTSSDFTEVRLGELVGSPDELFFISFPLTLYIVKDQSLLNLYVKSTTGLTIASSLPSGAQ